jgi:hypothetical protein
MYLAIILKEVYPANYSFQNCRIRGIIKPQKGSINLIFKTLNIHQQYMHKVEAICE